jgi:hypothetical protein
MGTFSTAADKANPITHKTALTSKVGFIVDTIAAKIQNSHELCSKTLAQNPEDCQGSYPLPHTMLFKFFDTRLAACAISINQSTDSAKVYDGI